MPARACFFYSHGAEHSSIWLTGCLPVSMRIVFLPSTSLSGVPWDQAFLLRLVVDNWCGALIPSWFLFFPVLCISARFSSAAMSGSSWCLLSSFRLCSAGLGQSVPPQSEMNEVQGAGNRTEKLWLALVSYSITFPQHQRIFARTRRLRWSWRLCIGLQVGCAQWCTCSSCS